MATAYSVNLTDYAADPTGATPSNGAFQRAWNAIKATGGTIVVPPGRYVFTAQEVVTLPDLRLQEPGKTIFIQGAGMDATTFHWPNANGGLKIVSGNVLNSLNCSDFSVTTAAENGGEGLLYYATDFYGGFVREQPSSSMTRIKASGFDTKASDDAFINVAYWTRALSVRGVYLVSFNDCVVYGSAPNGEQGYGSKKPDGTSGYVPNSVRRGKGICVEGFDRTPGAIPDLAFDGANGAKYQFGYGLLYNIYGGQINTCDVGVYYGDVVQGVNVSTVNFGYCRAAIETAPDPLRGDLAQLYITNCQSGAGTGTQVNLQSQLFTLGMTNCTWFLYPGQTGLYMKHPVPFTVVGSSFQGQGQNTAPTICIDMASADIPGGSIIGNIFRDAAIGIRLQAGTSGVVIDGNQFASLGIEVSNAGNRNVIGISNIGEKLTNPAVVFPASPGNGQGSRSLSFRSVATNGTQRDASFVADPDGNLNLLAGTDKLFAVQPQLVARSALIAQATLSVAGTATFGTVTGNGSATFNAGLTVGGNGQLYALGGAYVAGSTVLNGNVNVYGQATMSNSLMVYGNVGFYGQTPVAKPTITGQLTNNEAMLANIINALVTLGLVNNQTTF